MVDVRRAPRVRTFAARPGQATPRRVPRAAAAVAAAAAPPAREPRIGADAALRERLLHTWETPPGAWGKLASVDHKEIGVRYLVTAFLFLAIGGVEALLVRLQLAGPERTLLSPEAYDQVFSLHGITMIFWYAQPVLSGFGNYLVPLLIGARDMAFPRLNAFSYWAFLLSGIFLYASVPLGQAPDAGWFAYVPLTSRPFSPGPNLDFYALALVFLTVSTTAGAVNFLVTIFRLRAPGMALHRMPLMLYSTSTASALSLLALPALTAACLFLELDRSWGTRFFDVSHGGDALLWQQVFWFFGHPWVYIVFLPATGMVSMLLPVFCRRPIVGYAYVAVATVLTGVAGLGVWVHHMFAVGMGAMSMSFFAAASMTISVFSTVQVFAWLATIWLGRPVRTTSFLFALGFIANFVVGGLTGVMTAMIPFDWQIHDTYFVVGHLHYVLIGANVFPVFAAFYYWWPKMTGRLLDEGLGRWSFWLTFVGFNVAFLPMHAAGLLGMRRRVYTYGYDEGLGALNLVTTIASFVLAAGVLLSVANFLWSLRRGRLAGPDPWGADTLEWSIPSPPPPYAFARLPVVRSRHPLWDEVSAPEGAAGAPALDDGRQTLATSPADAEPRAAARMPRESLAPLVLSLALAALFAALLAKLPGLAALAGLAALGTAAHWLRPRSEAPA